jgi:hypothetical protein
VFRAIFAALAAMSHTAHPVRMFDTTIVRAHVSAAGAKGAGWLGAWALADFHTHEDPLQSLEKYDHIFPLVKMHRYCLLLTRARRVQSRRRLGGILR